MRKLVCSGLSLTLLAVAGTSHAQSSVTIYGILDTGLMYTSNSGGHSSYRQASGTQLGDRWGFLGAEDLGNGLKAIFRLENGFNLSNGALGQNGRMFGRQSYVGLSDQRLGTVTLGRQYMINYVEPLSLTSLSGLAVHPYANDNLNDSLWFNNAIKYQSVDYNGLKFGGMYAFSNSTNFADSRAFNIGASYSSGGLTVASDYLQLTNAGSSTNAAGAVAAGDSTFYAGRQRIFAAGANYAVGSAIVGMVFTQTQLDNAIAIGASAAGSSSNFPLTHGSARFTNYELNGSYMFTPTFMLSGNYVYTDSRLNGVTPKYQTSSLQLTYFLSKRTSLYAIGAYQHVSSTGNVYIPLHLNTTAAGSSTRSQAVLALGIVQRF